MIFGAVCWAKFGDKIVSKANSKIIEMQASFLDGLEA